MKRQDIKRRPMPDTVIESLEPEAVMYRERHGDGVYLRVKPNGMKDWQLRYKTPEGKWSWLGLGGYGKAAHQLSGQGARQKAAELTQEAKERGVSLMEAKTPPEAAVAPLETFSQLTREWLKIKKDSKSWTDGTYERAESMLENHILPVMGSRGYTAIPASDWFNLFKGMEEKGILETIAKVRAHCRDIYALAQVTDRAQFNPIDNLHKFLAASKNENFAHVSPEEVPELIRTIRGYKSRPKAIGLQLLMLLAVRPSELREARWEEFDLDSGVWDVAAIRKRAPGLFSPARTGNQAASRAVHLPHQRAIPVPGRSKGMEKPISNMTFNQALDRLGYKGRQTPHGMRHLFSTAANEAGKDYRIVDSALAHKVKGVEGVYNKAQYLAQRRELLQWWADRVDSLASSGLAKVSA